MNTYDIDTDVLVSSAFTQADGVTPVDPTTVTLIYLDPNGKKTTVAMGDLTKLSTGVFTSTINANVSGVWLYKFQGTGNVEVTTPDTPFQVNPSQLLPG